MNYFCPECGVPAKRYAGAAELKNGLPVICPEHGRVFVNPDKLPIVSLLSMPFSTEKSRRQSRESLRSTRYRQKNPHKDREWRAKNEEYLKDYDNKKWARIRADPVALAALNQKRREWYARNRVSESARHKRQRAKKGESCAE